MTTQDVELPPVKPAAPLGIAGLLRKRWVDIRAGETGSAPIILALVLIGAFFYSKNSNFVGATNFNNLIIQMAGVTMIAFGIVFVLLLGEIDLSVGYVSGLAGVTVAEMQLPGSNHEFPGFVAILLAIGVGVAIGAFQGSFVSFLGVPSFVVTLAGNLAWQGVILTSLPQGVIVIQNSTINNVANYFFPPVWGWIVGIAAGGVYAVTTLSGILSRKRHGIPTGNIRLASARIVGVLILCLLIVYKSNTDPRRGLPFAGVLVILMLTLWTFIANRTVFGRHVYAVGGNPEAARRAGINLVRIRMIVFMIAGGMAALGGVVFAARLRSVDLDAGGGTIVLDAIAAAVIGGVSLFGGRGSPKAAVLGSLVIAMIANGSDLVGYSAATQYIITGAILLAAVTLDTVSRRRLNASGR